MNRILRERPVSWSADCNLRS